MTQSREKRIAVLGTACGYSVKQLVPFLASVRQAVPDADVFLFVGQKSLKQAAALQKICPNCWLVVPSDSGLRECLRRIPRGRKVLCQTLLWVAKSLSPAVGPSRMMTAALGVAVARYVWYLEWINSSIGSQYSNVLIADTRDVLFQSDPSVKCPGDKLFCGLEPVLIKDCPANSAWIRQCYGQAELERFGDKPVLCSGFSGGSRDAVINYLEAMAAEILACGHKIALNGGYDQGIHNKIIHQGCLSGKVTFCHWKEDVIATMHYVRSNHLMADSERNLRTGDGRIVSIVHQYDRHPSLRAFVEQKYKGETST